MVTGRTLVLVVGSPESGVSVVADMLQGLGFHAPQADVADFHEELLARAGVQPADARPGAWATTAEVGMDMAVEQRLRAWLKRELAKSSDILVADAQLPWFLPLWRRCAEAVGVPPRFVLLLRHPAETVEGTERSSGTWEREVSRAVGWLNHTLYSERATREGSRVFVRYADVREDWPRAIGRVGETLDLAIVRDAPAYAIRGVHQSVEVDAGARARPDGGADRRLPGRLQALVDEAWTMVSRLANAPGSATGGEQQRLDELRAAYVELYREAEAIARSSLEAPRRAPRDSRPQPSAAGRLAQRLPRRYRDMVPLRWRRRAARALSR
jgi:hypothetical protein